MSEFTEKGLAKRGFEKGLAEGADMKLILTTALTAGLNISYYNSHTNSEPEDTQAVESTSADSPVTQTTSDGVIHRQYQL